MRADGELGLGSRGPPDTLDPEARRLPSLASGWRCSRAASMPLPMRVKAGSRVRRVRWRKEVTRARFEIWCESAALVTATFWFT